MKLTILGKYGPFPPSGGATSSYLLESDKTNVLLDVGAGSISRLVGKIDVCDLSFMVLSHLHFDHVSDVGVLSYALSFSKRKEKLNVYLPNFNCPMLETLKSIKDFNLIFIEEGKVYNDSGLEFSFYKMTHPVLCYGVKITDGKSCFAYSGDTTLNDNVCKLVQDCDLAVLDGAFIEKDFEGVKPHMSVKQASSFSKYTRGKVIVSHIGYKYDDNLVEDEIKSVSNNSEIAVEGKTYKF
ncbi:MAG: MBL fold metallo-hydrolase [Clostridiales bacterium]|nr:MBL fold metallo-hydrolase [Clostridiales bacterium]